MIGLFSDTWSRKSGQLGTIINNGQNDVISGRQPVSYWDTVLASWKAAGGDQIKKEWEDALQRSGGS